MHLFSYFLLDPKIKVFLVKKIKVSIFNDNKVMIYPLINNMFFPIGHFEILIISSLNFDWPKVMSKSALIRLISERFRSRL